MEAYPQLKAAALKAVALNEHEADGHVWLAEAKRVLDWDVTGAYSDLSRALELDPNSASAHSSLAFGEACLGRTEESAAHTQAALKLDPLSPVTSNNAAIAYLSRNEFDKAIAESKRTLELDPSYIYEMSVLATAYREKGMFPEAIVLYQKARETLGFPQSGLAVTYARMGRENDARQILNELRAIAETKYVPREQIAVIYTALNEKDEAFKWLDRACEEHSGNIHMVAIRPDFQPLHSDPRFAALLKRLGLDPDKVLARDKQHP
jgi:Flp pilus assembly protein TadD